MLFHSIYLHACKEPAVIPAALLDVLVITKLDLDVMALDSTVEYFFQHGLAESTQCTQAKRNRKGRE